MADAQPLANHLRVELDLLQENQSWQEIINRVDLLRDELGPVPELLFRSGFASAQLSDFMRAYRLMTDALLAEFNPGWLPWLAAVYDKLNWALPMWVIAHWLKTNDPEREGVLPLYNRAQHQISRELERRSLPVPPSTIPAINEPMAHKYNVRMVDLLQAGEGLAAASVGEAARRFYPHYLPLLVNLSVVYKRLNRLEESARLCLSSLALDPLSGGVISNFGSTLLTASAVADACRLLEAGAILFREDASIWCNLAVSYNNLHVAPWESELAARRAIAIDGKMAAAWSALAASLCAQGRMQESLEASQIVGELDPLRKNESLLNLNYSSTLTQEDVANAHFEAAEARYGRFYKSTEFFLNFDPDRRLNIGFVSGDLVAHPVSYFIEPIFEHLPAFCNVFVYHNRPQNGEDEVSDMLQGYKLNWRNVAALPDEALHQVILEDKIDVLVDLSGHTAYHRLPIFAMRSAPVQVEYMGYPNTTGIKAMDYYLCHGSAVSAGLQEFYCEKLYQLPRTAAVYRPLVKNKALIRDQKYEVRETPALRNGYITFGTLNNISKIDDNVVSTWSKILSKVENSRLFIESPGLHQKDFIKLFKKRFERFGIAAERIILKSRDTNLQYIRWNEIDIALDPFPYGGGTTTCDALWMGVPLVTLYGETLMSRAGLGALSLIGHDNWACSTEEEYVACAIMLASDTEELNKLRLGLRKRMEQSPLMNYARFAEDLAMAFKDMWRHYLNERGSL